MDVMARTRYQDVVDEIGDLAWDALGVEDMMGVAWAYYYFSIQFRESLTAARAIYPDDVNLQRLEIEECDTANLSPWPGVAVAGERMNHDEFMRRTLTLTQIPADQARFFQAAGEAYLAFTRRINPEMRALSIASYEDGGLETVFNGMLRFSGWQNTLLQAFRHFVTEHVRFDSDPDQGHGALSRHLVPDDGILPLWRAFRDLLVTCVPNLAALKSSTS